LWLFYFSKMQSGNIVPHICHCWCWILLQVIDYMPWHNHLSLFVSTIFLCVYIIYWIFLVLWFLLYLPLKIYCMYVHNCAVNTDSHLLGILKHTIITTICRCSTIPYLGLYSWYIMYYVMYTLFYIVCQNHEIDECMWHEYIICTNIIMIMINILYDNLYTHCQFK